MTLIPLLKRIDSEVKRRTQNSMEWLLLHRIVKVKIENAFKWFPQLTPKCFNVQFLANLIWTQRCVCGNRYEGAFSVKVRRVQNMRTRCRAAIPLCCQWNVKAPNQLSRNIRSIDRRRTWNSIKLQRSKLNYLFICVLIFSFSFLFLCVLCDCRRREFSRNTSTLNSDETKVSANKL